MADVTRSVLTDAEIALIKKGYRHMVDNGYADIKTARDLLRVMQCNIVYAEREIGIGKLSGFDTALSEDRVKEMNAAFQYLAERVLRSEERG